MQILFIIAQHLVPHHLLSRLVGRFADSRTPWIKDLFIRRFIKTYRVNMAEALDPDPASYENFNAFFTRALKADARPLVHTPGAIVAPADGVVSAIGAINQDSMVQAKGHDYSVTALLGGDPIKAAPFRNGSFATIYLSPKDYHRVHIPLAGTLQEMLYVPGKLFSVNLITADNIANLFARNERAVCMFDTEAGPMAVVLVGAMIVAGIETVWGGHVCPTADSLKVSDYRNAEPPVRLEKGAELGRFKLGSTVILLFGPGAMQWHAELSPGSAVRMGEQMGTLTHPEAATRPF